MTQPKSLHFLIGHIVFTGVLVNFLLLTHAWDQWLILLTIPIIAAALIYTQRIYLLLEGISVAGAVLTLYGFFLDPSTSLKTVGVLSICVLVVSELVFRLSASRGQALQRLALSEVRFQQLAANLGGAFLLSGENLDDLFYVSPGFQAIWGVPWKNTAAFLESIIPEDRDKVRDFLRRQAIEKTEARYRIMRADGQIRWVRHQAFPFEHSECGTARIAAIAEDITGQCLLEIRSQQAQKMELLGKLASGIAHDFNNLLTLIQGGAAKLATAEELSAESHLAALEIRAVSGRAANLTSQLLAFGRGNVGQRKTADLNRVVQEMEPLLRRLIGESISLRFSYASGVLPVKADPVSLEQVVLNLVINARDATAGGGVIEIRTGRASASARKQIPKYASSGRACGTLTVRDFGCGISPSDLPRIFEPFFTTKSNDKGTGIGLATVRQIVAQHEGMINVQSEVNRGTTFEITFPGTDEPLAADDDARTRPSRPCGGTERILLIEDDRHVRRFTKDVLELAGYRVLEADSASVAVKLWSNHRSAIDLVMTDLVLTDSTGGLNLTKGFVEDKPEVKVILTSGYSPELVNGDTPQHDTRFLQKPYSPDSLLRTARELLDRSNPEMAGSRSTGRRV